MRHIPHSCNDNSIVVMHFRWDSFLGREREAEDGRGWRAGGVWVHTMEFNILFFSRHGQRRQWRRRQWQRRFTLFATTTINLRRLSNWWNLIKNSSLLSSARLISSQPLPLPSHIPSVYGFVCACTLYNTAPYSLCYCCSLFSPYTFSNSLEFHFVMCFSFGYRWQQALLYYCYSVTTNSTIEMRIDRS